MGAREEKWIMTRMRRKTRDALREWLKVQDSNYARGCLPGLRGACHGVVSVDAAVCELLRRDDAHRARARKSSKKRAIVSFMDEVYRAAHEHGEPLKEFPSEGNEKSLPTLSDRL